MAMENKYRDRNLARRRNIFNKTKGKCFYCGCVLDFSNFHIDHFVPKIHGGKDRNNVVPSCPDCNLIKSDLDIESFRSKIASLIRTDIKGRIIAKYYPIKSTDIVFWFEENTDEDLQEYINNILE